MLIIYRCQPLVLIFQFFKILEQRTLTLPKFESDSILVVGGGGDIILVTESDNGSSKYVSYLLKYTLKNY